MSERGDPAAITARWASALADELARAGVEWVAVAPGSRSTPLVLALDRSGRFRTVVHLDERSAAFFALGVGKASGTPAAVVTTSGTAVANLLPAVVEAAASESPLLLLTADRPDTLRGGDANQAIDQHRIFGHYTRWFVELGPPQASEGALRHARQSVARAVADARTRPGGPVHINLPFRKPLQPSDPETSPGPDPWAGREGRPYTVVSPGRLAAHPDALAGLCDLVDRAERIWVVAGPSANPVPDGQAARTLARAWNALLLADPLSGARFGSGRHLDHYDLLLADDEIASALRPDLVVRIGRSPTSQALTDRIAQAAAEGVDVVLLDPGGRWKDHRGAVSHVVRCDPLEAVPHLVAGDETQAATDPLDSDPWAHVLGPVSEAVRSARDAALPDTSQPVEGDVIRRACAAIKAGQDLFVSSSMPIRDVDAFVGAHDLDEDVAVQGNRGASGIDGIVSSALGVASATGRPTLCVLGDLALLHDLNGFLNDRLTDAPAVFLVINNDGGGIFHRLPIRDHDPPFTRYFATPHGRQLDRAAALHGLDYQRLDASSVTDAVSSALAAGTVQILEVQTDRDAQVSLRASAAERIQEAARANLRSRP